MIRIVLGADTPTSDALASVRAAVLPENLNAFNRSLGASTDSWTWVQRTANDYGVRVDWAVRL